MSKKRETRLITIASFVISLVILGIALIGNRDEIASWSGYDFLRPSADERKIRILVASLSADSSGEYSAELENSLVLANKRFRKLGRQWLPDEEERLNPTLLRKSINELLARHDSDAFIYGHVGPSSVTVWLVPRDIELEVRRYEIRSNENYSSLIVDLEPVLVLGMQKRIDGGRYSIGKNHHILIDHQIGDLLSQTKSIETRRQLLFQSAFTKDKLGFWRNEPELTNESMTIYEELLADVTDPVEESMIRINLAISHQTRGIRDSDIDSFVESSRHLKKAEPSFAEHSDVRRWAKVRNLMSANDIWLSHLTGDSSFLIHAIKRQRGTIEDTMGWLSDVDAFLVFQEGVGANLVLAYQLGATNALRHSYELLVSNMELWRLRAIEEGEGNNPWIQALINCTAMQLIEPMALERALEKESSSSDEEDLSPQIEWTDEEISQRRTNVASWLAVARKENLEATSILQLDRLANLTREEALRTHDVDRLEESFKLTKEYRELANVESASIRLNELLTDSPFAEAVFEIEGSFALACADRDGIEYVLKLLRKGRTFCNSQPKNCDIDMSRLEHFDYWLRFGLGRWEHASTAEDSSREDFSTLSGGPWQSISYHAHWLRNDLIQLPLSGESFCPSRTPWVVE